MPEAIDVISVFSKKTVRPVKFKYAGRTHTIAKILYTWVTREGGYPVYHFSVLTDSDDRFHVELHTQQMDWQIEGAGH